MRQRFVLALILTALSGPATAVTFVVSNSNDSGPGSFRQAILDANGTPGADVIEFALPENAPAILLQTPLPAITNAVTIGGSGMGMLEIDGAQVSGGASGLHITGHDVWIQGVAIHGFGAQIGGGGGEGILIEGGSGAVIVACFIGTDRQGASLGNGGPGVRILDSSFNVFIRNVITTNLVGVLIEGDSDSNEFFENSIGRLNDTGNLGHGMVILSGSDNALTGFTICTICASNVVGGNGGNGVVIGPDAVGTVVGEAFVISNGGHGVEIQGGQGSIINARISGNGGDGVHVGSGTGHTIAGRISDNAGLGIDLAPAGVTGNDPGDTDNGPNGLQNFPILTSVVTSPGAVVTLTGMLQSASNSPYVLDFYDSSSCDGSGNGEGANHIGSANVVTDGAGNAPFNVVFNSLVLSGPSITATATDGAGSTSEFSSCVLAAIPVVSQIDPDSGPDTGGTPVEILGLNFDSAASVKIGGADAVGVVVTSPTQIDAGTPALPPGTLNEVRITNPDGQEGVLEEAWFSNFLDVPEGHLFHDFVETIFREHVTAGCGFGNYCVDQAVPREQMAVFLLRSRYGPTYVPPPATGMVFPNDVPADGFAADYIEELNALGITAGCGPGSFCPTDPVTRAQMSVFLLRTLEGITYNPPPETGTVFTDVPVGSFAAAWIEEIHARGITAGCDVTLFCPDASTTRGQMAVFLTVTFSLGAP
jgi:hypothetical protein